MKVSIKYQQIPSGYLKMVNITHEMDKIDIKITKYKKILENLENQKKRIIKK